MKEKSDNNKSYRWNLHRFYLLFFIFLICVIFYYFGEIVDFFKWDFLRLNFFYGVHDIHRLLFLIPIIYCAYYFGLKPTIIIIILMICAFMPRALFISHYPDPLLRASLFSIIATAVGILTAFEIDKRKRLEKIVNKSYTQAGQLMDYIDEDIIIVGLDYKIRFVSQKLKTELGDGLNKFCYTYLYNLNEPCTQGCYLKEMRPDKFKEKEYQLLSGKRYKVTNLPYTDKDGATCQLMLFKEMK